MKLKKLLKETITWNNRKFGERLPTLDDYKKAHGKKEVNERMYSELEKYETAIFDVIIQFKKVYERSEHKKNRKINKLIQDLLKLEAKLGDEVTELS